MKSYKKKYKKLKRECKKLKSKRCKKSGLEFSIKDSVTGDIELFDKVTGYKSYDTGLGGIAISVKPNSKTLKKDIIYSENTITACIRLRNFKLIIFKAFIADVDYSDKKHGVVDVNFRICGGIENSNYFDSKCDEK